MNQYQKEVKAKDNDGKSLYGVLINEVKSMRKDRENLVEIIVKYIIENEKQSVEELSNYVINKVKA